MIYIVTRIQKYIYSLLSRIVTLVTVYNLDQHNNVTLLQFEFNDRDTDKRQQLIRMVSFFLF